MGDILHSCVRSTRMPQRRHPKRARPDRSSDRSDPLQQERAPDWPRPMSPSRQRRVSLSEACFLPQRQIASESAQWEREPGIR